jgi:hypothetical protein
LGAVIVRTVGTQQTISLLPDRWDPRSTIST